MTKIEAMIQQEVNVAFEAGQQKAKNAPYDAFKATEKRLRALPILKDKLEKDRDRLEELEEYGLHGHSNDIIRFQRSGRCVSDEDVLAALIQDMKATIAATEFEIQRIEEALALLSEDEYFEIIELKYFKGKKDDDIAEALHCDPRTVRRNKNRLVEKISVRLYGVDAVI